MVIPHTATSRIGFLRARLEPDELDVPTEVTLLEGLERLALQGLEWKTFREFLNRNGIVWVRPESFVVSSRYDRVRVVSELPPEQNQRTYAIEGLSASLPPLPIAVSTTTTSTTTTATTKPHAQTSSDAAAVIYTRGPLQFAADALDDILHLSFHGFSGIAISYEQPDPAPAPLLASVTSLQRCFRRNAFRHVRLAYLTLSVAHCRGLGMCLANIDHVELVHVGCSEEDTFLQSLGDAFGRNQGPVQFHMTRCWATEHATQSLVSRLAHNSRLRFFSLRNMGLPQAVWEHLAKALPENRGLIHLDLSNNNIEDGPWKLLMKALHRHPSMERLWLFGTSFQITTSSREQRTRAVLELLRVNTRLRDIQAMPLEWCDFYFQPVRTHLHFNQSLALSESLAVLRPPAPRGALLGAALGNRTASRQLVFLLLQQNHDLLCTTSRSHKETCGCDCEREIGKEFGRTGKKTRCAPGGRSVAA
jgi:hypothetical protein